MPSFGILCAAMFRFERERVLHCSLYRGTVATYPVYFGDGNHISGLCLQREMAVAYTFSSPIPSAFLCLCYYLPYLHGTVKPEHASLVPRYRSKWQDHVGTSALRCRSLASYVPLCSDLSESASCTAPCIAGRWLHTRSLPVSRDGRIVTTWRKKGTRAFTYPACLRLDLILPPSVPGRIRPPHLKSPQRSLH